MEGYTKNEKVRSAIVAIKLLHTVVWCFFVICIGGIWVAAAQKRFVWGAGLTGIVLVECAVLAINRGRCPLTGLA
jgi:hypothetical protein